MALGEKIKQLRELHDLTQVELAKQAHVTQAYVARIESKKVDNPKASGLVGLAKALDVPVEVLLDDAKSIDGWQNELDSIRIDTTSRELLSVYRSLRPKDRKQLIEYSRFLKKSASNK